MDTKQVTATLHYEDAAVSFSTASTLDLLLIRRGAEQGIEALTGYPIDEFVDGMGKLLAPIDGAAA